MLRVQVHDAGDVGAHGIRALVQLPLDRRALRTADPLAVEGELGEVVRGEPVQPGARPGDEEPVGVGQPHRQVAAARLHQPAFDEVASGVDQLGDEGLALGRHVAILAHAGCRPVNRRPVARTPSRRPKAPPGVARQSRGNGTSGTPPRGVTVGRSDGLRTGPQTEGTHTMGFLDRLLGRTPTEQHRQDAGWGSGRNTQPAAAPPTGGERGGAGGGPVPLPAAHRAARAARGAARRGVREADARAAPAGAARAVDGIARVEAGTSSEPADLARAATRAEMRQPGTLQNTFSRGSFGGGMGWAGCSRAR